MRVTVKTGIIFALLWMIVKMIFFWTGEVGYDIRPVVMINMLFLMMAIAIGLYLLKRKNPTESNALTDIKNGLSAGLPYTILVSVFIYFYYSNIDPGYNEHQISTAYNAIYEKLEDPESLAEIKEQNPDFEVKTKEEILAEAKNNLEQNYNAKFTMTLSLLALLLLSTIYSIFISVVYRKIVFKPENLR